MNERGEEKNTHITHVSPSILRRQGQVFREQMPQSSLVQQWHTVAHSAAHCRCQSLDAHHSGAHPSPALVSMHVNECASTPFTCTCFHACECIYLNTPHLPLPRCSQAMAAAARIERETAPWRQQRHPSSPSLARSCPSGAEPAACASSQGPGEEKRERERAGKRRTMEGGIERRIRDRMRIVLCTVVVIPTSQQVAVVSD